MIVFLFFLICDYDYVYYLPDSLLGYGREILHTLKHPREDDSIKHFLRHRLNILLKNLKGWDKVLYDAKNGSRSLSVT